jgi:Transposase DDE domain group 1
VRADVEGGALSSDFGALLLRGSDRQMGLTARLAAAIPDKRHPSSIAHTLRALLAQRLSQIASGYAEGNDAKSLRHAPRCKLSVERPPLEPAQALARAPPFSRLAHRGDRNDLSRLAQACVDHCMAGSPAPPAALGLALDHADEPTHGQQAWTFYTHPYQSDCSLPRCMCEGPAHALVTACLRPGKRPTGAVHALVFVRLLSSLRRHWPQTHLLVRGDSPCATPEGIEGIAHRRLTDCVFGLAGHAVLLCQAAPVMQEARRLSPQRTALAQAHGACPPARSRL